ncbi:hypothetical protein U7230_13010 [Carboxydochorda subterranea]|uniref:ATP-grasp domain-containing protein n=1 Tax=Carboxydichorda subterranea TaxID=3109565 RepID=A0ABZ1BY39_9FIRM|nr:hypothetical protein [Limnochorda sp. L945t]WRP16993.1 hypothetical protein U7230_13010 [Limnochorda sp. L945t]
MQRVRLGLAFNLRREAKRDGPEDQDAEYDAWSTVSALAEALSFGNTCQVIPLPVERDFASLLERHPVDAVFNMAEGWGGRSRELLAPAVLEMAGVPYTGSDPVALGLAMDKAIAKAVVQSAGVPTAPSVVVSRLEELEAVAPECSYPAFVKPVAEGSSKGVRVESRVDTPEQLARQVERVLRVYRQPALVEAFLPGREFSVGILGNDRLRCLPVLEVRPLVPPDDPGRFIYCYHTKSRNLEAFLCPAPIDRALEARLVALTQTVFRALSLRDVARVDFRLDSAGQPRFLEVNPLPGLSAASLLTAQGAAAGLDLPHLVASIVAAAASRWVQEPGLGGDRLARLMALRQVASEMAAAPVPRLHDEAAAPGAIAASGHGTPTRSQAPVQG